nr:retrotransposon Gag domain, retroviral aspartyl protease [Tanacetum cinerariifolium]
MAAIDASMKAQLKGKGSTHNEFQASSKPPWNEETNFDGDAPWWVKKHNHRNHIKTEFPRFNEEDLRDHTLIYWEDLVKVLQEHYGPTDFQNPNEHLFGIRKMGTVQEYRQEFAKHSSRVKNWPELCLLGVFLNRFHNSVSVFVVGHSRGVLEFEQKVGHSRGAPK